MRRSLIATIAAASLAAAPGAVHAQQNEERPAERSPSELAGEGLEKLMLALELLLQAIPQYEMPEVLDNGDIIIRRVPEGERREAPGPEREDDEPPVETLRPEQEET